MSLIIKTLSEKIIIILLFVLFIYIIYNYKFKKQNLFSTDIINPNWIYSTNRKETYEL
jgi:4-hydroxybenzoate polyprenyltransferase